MLKRKIIGLVVIGSLVAGNFFMGAQTTEAAVSDTDNTTINVDVAATISMTTSGTVTISITPTGGGATGTGDDTVTVTTNDNAGYVLALKDADATLNLVNGANTIIPTSGTFGGSGAALDTNSWGYRTSAQSWTAGFYAAITAIDQTIRTTATPQVGGEVTTVTYAAKVTTAKPSGTYTDTVTYTATGQTP